MGGFKLFNEDCFEWLAQQPENSFHAIVTDPPYGVKEYTPEELLKKENKSGGIWRIPPTLDGCQRNPLPRFSVINDNPKEREALFVFFLKFAKLANKVLAPGGHLFIASTPLLCDVLSSALREGQLERRGEIIRRVLTLRGGDRPKGSEEEFQSVSVIPRGLWEPWCLYRKPLSEKTVAQNLRKWSTGALRRPSPEQPFYDFIESEKATRAERKIANHPSLKPQSFLRKIVHASLPLGTGIVLDPFAGSGSTIAAASFLGYESVGVERNQEYFEMASRAIPLLAAL